MLGDVADKTAECPAFANAKRCDRQLDRKFGAVSAERRDFQPPAENGPFPGGQKTAQTLLVIGPVSHRDQNLREPKTYDFLARPAEHRFGLSTPFRDMTLLIDAQDRIERGVDELPNPRLPLLKIVIETDVFQRHPSLRSEQFENGHPVRGEGAKGQVVFEVNQSEQLSLLKQG